MSALAPATARPGAHRLPRTASPDLPLGRVAAGVMVLLACAALLGQLIGAVRAEAASAPTGPVSISTEGRLDTSGLASGATTVSALTITNPGDEPVRWAAYPRVDGTPGVADRLEVAAYAPTGPGCSASGAPVTLGTPSAAPLAPGQSTTLCVVMSLPADAAAIPGSVTPSISVVGTPGA